MASLETLLVRQSSWKNKVQYERKVERENEEKKKKKKKEKKRIGRENKRKDRRLIIGGAGANDCVAGNASIEIGIVGRARATT